MNKAFLQNYAVSYGADSSSHHHSARSRRSVSNGRFHLTDHQFVSSSSSSRGHSVDGIAVSVQIDMSHCQEDCFSDSEAFVKYWAAYMAKEYEVWIIVKHNNHMVFFRKVIRIHFRSTKQSSDDHNLELLAVRWACSYWYYLFFLWFVAEFQN